MSERSRILFVGEQSGGTVEGPAFGYPRGSALRLASMLGLSHAEMLQRFEFINLLSPGTWSARRARTAAVHLDRMDYDKMVFLGKKVAEAVGFYGRPHLSKVHLGGRSVLLFPHPSGRNRVLNNPRYRGRCAKVLRRFVE